MDNLEPKKVEILPSLREVLGELFPLERQYNIENTPGVHVISAEEYQPEFDTVSTQSSVDTIIKEEAKDFTCEWKNCEEGFTTRAGLATHVTVHIISLENQLQFSCQWNSCLQTFRKFTELVKHLSQESHVGQTPFIPRRPISVSSGKVFVCNYPGCERIFNDASNKKKHEQTHEKNRRRFYCNYKECSRSYSTETDMKIHKKSHMGDLPFKCSHSNCSRTFVRVSELYAHERTHDNVFPHSCSKCGKGFKDKSKCTQHEQTHKET